MTIWINCFGINFQVRTRERERERGERERERGERERRRGEGGREREVWAELTGLNVKGFKELE